MANFQKVNLGTAPAGTDGDPVRAAFVKVNANVDVISAQVPLTTTYLPDGNVTLDGTYVGKRIGLAMSVPGRMVALPKASSIPTDQCMLLWNIGAAVSMAFQQGDGAELAIVNRGDWVLYVSDGTSYWHVQQRGRNLPDEVVVGSLTVGGSLSTAALSAAGKVYGVNSPNILVNGSGELGNVNWASGNFGATVGGAGEGAIFTNGGAINGTLVDASLPIQCLPGVPLVIAAECYAGGLSAGAAQVDCQFLDASKNSIGYSPSRATFPSGSGNAFNPAWAAFTTPNNTAYVVVRKYCDGNPVAAASAAVRFRKIKLGVGTLPDLYSNEATIAYLSSTATDTAVGLTRTATQAEVNAGTVDYPAVVTPKKLRLGFGASLGTTGYLAFPTWLGGLIFNWGQTSTNSGGDATVAFTKPFATTQFVCIPVIVSNYTNCLLTMTGFTLTNANFHVNDYTGSGGVRPLQYLAVGI